MGQDVKTRAAKFKQIFWSSSQETTDSKETKGPNHNHELVVRDRAYNLGYLTFIFNSLIAINYSNLEENYPLILTGFCLITAGYFLLSPETTNEIEDDNQEHLALLNL